MAHRTIQGQLNSSGMRFAIVASRFNDFVTSRLLGGALDALERTGAAEADITVVRVPGSFEIPLAAKRLVQTKKYDAVICLGTLIRGETPHFDYICNEVTKGIGSVSLESGTPVAFGVLTSDSVEQAIDRAGMKSGNKGFEAAMSAVEMVSLLKQSNNDGWVEEESGQKLPPDAVPMDLQNHFKACADLGRSIMRQARRTWRID
jgi:6,7-dimethyl-8-ribityllumazine synthase